MKVSELITKLQQFDPEEEIVTHLHPRNKNHSLSGDFAITVSKWYVHGDAPVLTMWADENTVIFQRTH